MRSVPTQLSIPKLRVQFDGKAIAPGDDQYDEMRATFYGGMNHRPSVIIRAANAIDVADVIAVARDSGHELSVRSGGHSLAGHGVSDGRHHARLSGDAVTRDRRRGPDRLGRTRADGGRVHHGGCGARPRDRVRRHRFGRHRRDHARRRDRLPRPQARPHDRLPARGRGRDRRRRGPARRRRARTRTCSGRSAAAAATSGSPPGSGSGCTRSPTIVGGMLILPATPDVDRRRSSPRPRPPRRALDDRERDARPADAVRAGGGARQARDLGACSCYAGDVEAGERAIAPFRALATPIADMVRPMPYPEMYMPEEEDYHPIAADRTMFVDSLDRNEAETILDHLEASTAMMRVAQLGSSAARWRACPRRHRVRPPREPDHGQRRGVFEDAEEWRRTRRGSTDLAAAMQQGDTGAYVNFLEDEGEERIRAAYPGRLGAARDDQGDVRPDQPVPAEPERPAGGVRLMRPSRGSDSGRYPKDWSTINATPPWLTNGVG